MFRDFRHAARSLGRSPAFVAVAVLTLGLGIGASAAIFSVVDADRLVVMWQRDLRTGTPLGEISYAEFLEWKERTRTFQGAAAMTATNFRVNITGRAEPVQVEAAAVSWDFFELLGVRPVVGRSFAAAEDAPGAGTVVMLSQRFWQRRFGGDPALVGGSLVLDGAPATVAGIVPD